MLSAPKAARTRCDAGARPRLRASHYSSSALASVFVFPYLPCFHPRSLARALSLFLRPSSPACLSARLSTRSRFTLPVFVRNQGAGRGRRAGTEKRRMRVEGRGCRAGHASRAASCRMESLGQGARVALIDSAVLRALCSQQAHIGTGGQRPSASRLPPLPPFA